MKKKLPIPLLILAAVVIFYLWYTRPVTVWELCPLISPQDLVSAEGKMTRYVTPDHPAFAPKDLLSETPVFTPEDPEFEELTAFLDQFRVRRSLRDLLSNGFRTHSIQIGDYQWGLKFKTSNNYIEVRFWFDRVLISSGDIDEFDGSFVEQETTAQAVYDFLHPAYSYTK